MSQTEAMNFNDAINEKSRDEQYKNESEANLSKSKTDNDDLKKENNNISGDIYEQKNENPENNPNV